ncbi:MAG: LLM class flavin-dependent oxidoreductase [Proteobacteria bacterium]|nr:LLM class flavin-dependent oxidoreductase [Pseudomonadota bacterium]
MTTAGIRFGVSFDGFAPVRDAVALACEAEAAGASSFWIADHVGYRDTLVTATAIAGATTTLRVVPTALSPYLRHPTPTAMALASIAEMAPGRLEVAIGVGNPLFLQESGHEVVKPVGTLRDYVAALKALWATQPVEMKGQTFTLAGAKLAFAAPYDIPVYLAPMKEQMLKLSGSVGDGLVLSAGLTVNHVRNSLAIAEAGAVAAGRPFTSLKRAAYIIFIANEGSEAEARLLARQKLAFLLRNRFLDDSIRDSGLPIDQPAIIAAVSRRDLDAATALVPEEAIDAFTVTGDVAGCARRLRQYLDAGVDEPVLVPTGELADRRRSLAAARKVASLL